jgi:hypothetical protein
MSHRQSLDLEVFQTFLANAFAVQESGLDRRSLSALIEIQRFIGGDDFKLDSAMTMIADRALGVSHASGVAIGLLDPKRNELVYKAGSGNATKDVGRRVPAVLSASSIPDMRREILRVENAASDPRIEAEICRQFGAMSLVMLPIYRDKFLAGVLQILFDGAHSFAERELRAYRLMAGALEEAMSRSTQSVPEVAPAVVAAPIPGSEALAEQQTRFAEPGPEMPASAYGTTQDAPRLSFVEYAERISESVAESLDMFATTLLREVARMRSMLTRVVGIAEAHWNPSLRNATAAIGAAVVLSITVWVGHRSGVRNEITDLSSGAAHDAQLQLTGKPVASEPAKSLGGELKEGSAPTHGFRRVRVGPNEVDYISEDVTIRKFEPIRPTPQVRRTGKEVTFGDDVTVRYFVKPTLASQSSSASEVSPVR